MSSVQYRIYAKVDGASHSPSMVVECVNDVEALTVALGHIQANGWAEVWPGPRFLGKIMAPQA